MPLSKHLFNIEEGVRGARCHLEMFVKICLYCLESVQYIFHPQYWGSPYFFAFSASLHAPRRSGSGGTGGNQNALVWWILPAGRPPGWPAGGTGNARTGNWNRKQRNPNRQSWRKRGPHGKPWGTHVDPLNPKRNLKYNTGAPSANIACAINSESVLMWHLGTHGDRSALVR